MLRKGLTRVIGLYAAVTAFASDCSRRGWNAAAGAELYPQVLHAAVGSETVSHARAPLCESSYSFFGYDCV